MEIEALRKEPHLSASSVAGYLECGLAYRFGKVDGLAPEFTPDVLVFGSAIHEVLAEYYRSMSKGVRLSGDHLKKSFEKQWSERAADNGSIRYKEGTDYRSYLEQGKAMLAVFAAQVPVENCKVLAVEEPFCMNIEGLPAPLIGIYDLVIEDSSGVITIVDHKTSAKSYSVDQVDQNFQMTLYQAAAKANGFAGREILLRLDALIKTKVPKFEQYYTTRSQGDEQGALKRVLVAWEGISKGVYLPASVGSWRCSGCVYQDACGQWMKGEIP
ncbi:RecB family exonuclease [Desulfoferula mesophila]|uniref:PD-(D/E)XK endonuclease-like domain-containing protein n=1 Tax=Desulfoferula mesophila TaxID=3058419 RepID=A0AAU9EKY8_9BACT|nr:hypothetical protein FAK_09200 [Desulfoferula mesophilus]